MHSFGRGASYATRLALLAFSPLLLRARLADAWLAPLAGGMFDALRRSLVPVLAALAFLVALVPAASASQRKTRDVLVVSNNWGGNAAAFAASGWARTMTGAALNISCGAFVD